MKALLNFIGKVSIAFSGLVGFYMAFDWMSETLGFLGTLISVLLLPLVAMIYPFVSGLFLSDWTPFLVVYGMAIGGGVLATITSD